MTAKDVGRRLWNYPYRLHQSTRWLDNDMYSHLNNSVYPLLADSINNTYLIDHCGIDPKNQAEAAAGPSKAAYSSTLPPSPTTIPSAASVIGLVISSSADFYAPASFPNRLQTGLRVIQLGSSSVTYEVGIFEIPPQNTNTKSSSMSSENEGDPTPSPLTHLSKDALACCIVRTTHVFVDRHTRRPVKPMPKELYEGLSSLKLDRFMLDKGSSPKL
ncbi:hypothetical protein CBS101457_002661 [Exobasidium rhododendri]|nr:hypothetical protein CBS101457_002661 [Exobasidium rhododendri]